MPMQTRGARHDGRSLTSTSPLSTTTVLICDDDPIVRGALRAAITAEADLELRGAVASAREAVSMMEDSPAQVVLMDTGLPLRSSLDAVRSLTARHPETAILMLAPAVSEDEAREAISAGAAGFLAKSPRTSTLLAAIRAAGQGAGTVMTPELALQLAAARTPAAEPPLETVRSEAIAAAGLRGREMEVLAELCRGSSNTEIAGALRLSPSTVKTHLAALSAKLEVTTRTKLMVRAFEMRLVPLPGSEAQRG